MKNPVSAFRGTALTLAVALITIHPRPVSAAPQLVSPLNPSLGAPANGNGDSWGPVISPDGRYVLFASTADNLALIGASNGIPRLNPPSINVYLRDRINRTTSLVSVNAAGTGGGNGNSFPTALSTNGQFALFESAASDLVENDTNGVNDVFLRDTVNNLTWLVSIPINGVCANGVSRGSTMTPDGRFVAFTSAASNLVANDTNKIPDVFVRDLQGGTTVLASARAAGPATTSSSESPEITPDGHYVAFYSSATNLVSGVTNSGEIYVRDLQANTTYWASTNARAISGFRTYSFCFNQAISDDGQHVAFEISATDLLNSPYTYTTNGYVLRYNLQSGLTDIVFTNAFCPGGLIQELRSLNLTPDGRFIASVVNWAGGATAVSLWDAQTGASTLVSGNDTNGVTPGANACSPDIDAMGRYVVFVSTDTNLTTNVIGGVFMRDVQAGATTLVSVDTNGVNLPVNVLAVPALSAGGGSVAFESPWANLDGRNLESDVFARDLTNTVAELISAHHPMLPSLTPAGLGSLWPGSVSSNGQYIAFSSWAANLAPNDTNQSRDVFVCNLAAGAITLVSAATNGFAGNDFSSEPSISASGRYVAFTSAASNLVTGDTNNVADVFVSDLQSNTISLVSVSLNGGFGNLPSYSPVISTDGRFVLFSSEAQNLAAGTSANDNLFVRDRQAGQTYGLTTSGYLWYSMTPNGSNVAFIGSRGAANYLYVWSSSTASLIYTNTLSGITIAGISPDAHWVAYATGALLYAQDLIAGTNTLIASEPFGPQAGLKFSGDGRFLTYAGIKDLYAGFSDVYLYDLQTGANVLVSHATNSTAFGNGPSDSPVVSADGRFVAYRSFASNCVAGNFNGAPQVFLFDNTTGSNFLVTANLAGAPGNNRSLSPVFSADGNTLVIQSWASDLVAGDYNSGSDVFAFNVASVAGISSTNPPPAFVAEMIFPGNGNSSPGQPSLISWPYVFGHSYTVQYKDNLGDPAWQVLTGVITVNGTIASTTDPSPSASQRFYRIIQN